MDIIKSHFKRFLNEYFRSHLYIMVKDLTNNNGEVEIIKIQHLICQNGDKVFQYIFNGYTNYKKLIEFCEIETKSNFVNCLKEIIEKFQDDNKKILISELLAYYIDNLYRKSSSGRIIDLKSYLKDLGNIMEILPEKEQFLMTYLKLSIRRLDNFDYDNELCFIEKISEKYIIFI